MKFGEKALLSTALIGAAIGGGVIGSTVVGSAGAQTSSTSSTTASGNSSTDAQSSMPAHGSAAHEDAEKAVTGDNATQAQAAAVKSVGSGTAGAVTKDFTGNGYEVTVTKSNGTQVEVHMDNSFNVMTGRGGPGGSGA